MVGAELPGGLKIKKAKLRGVESVSYTHLSNDCAFLSGGDYLHTKQFKILLLQIAQVPAFPWLQSVIMAPVLIASITVAV